MWILLKQLHFVAQTLGIAVWSWLRNGNIYGIPAAAESVLKIVPSTKQVSAIGRVPSGKWKWHGAAIARDGAIYCIPANVALSFSLRFIHVPFFPFCLLSIAVLVGQPGCKKRSVSRQIGQVSQGVDNQSVFKAFQNQLFLRPLMYFNPSPNRSLPLSFILTPTDNPWQFDVAMKITIFIIVF